MNKSLAIIPARMAASRYPGKPMVKIQGMPMIEHIWRRVSLADCFSKVVVATCDQEIFDHITNLGGEAVMTLDTHERCTDRTAEALLKVEDQVGYKFDIIAMVQGDEPLVDPEVFKTTMKRMSSDPEGTPVYNLIGSIDNDADFHSAHVVKVVTGVEDHALYFSRQPIPTHREGVQTNRLRQTGLIFFRRDFLITYNRLLSTPLEKAESVDMMRVLEHGYRIKTVFSTMPCLAIDVPEDLPVVDNYMKQDPYFPSYQASNAP